MISIFIILFLFAFLLIFIGFFLIYLFFLSSILFGAPFVPAPSKKIQRMLKTANPKSGELIYDLGSGDARILIEAVKKYKVKAVGIEINPILVWISRRRIRKLGLENKIKIYQGNFFKKNFSDADIILIYLLQPTMKFLEKKFLSELKTGTKIISLSFTFKKIPLIKSDLKYSSVRLYQIPKNCGKTADKG